MTRQTAGPPSKMRMGLKVLVAAAVLIGGFQAVGEVVSAEPTIGEIEAAWKSRRQQFQSVECKWDATRFDKAGSMTSPFGVANAAAVPRNDKITHYSRSLLYHNGMVRTEDRGGEYLAQQRDGSQIFRKMNIMSTWNKKKAYSMMDYAEGYPQGNIGIKPEATIVDVQFNWVFAACCLPYRGGVDLTKYRITGTKRFEDKEVLVLQKRKLRPVDDAEIWLSPEPPYVIERIISKCDGTTFGWRTIDYALNEDGMTVPKAAFYVFLDADGKYDSAVESAVTSFKVNPPVDDSDFLIEFPVGTLMADFSSGKFQSYILREGGKKRMIDPAEIRRGATYEQLLEAEEGQAGLEVPEPGNR